MNRKKTVIIGMSGGVDSSVAAYILKEQGYNCIGITMKLWGDAPLACENRPAPCCGEQAFRDALRVAFHIGIPHRVLDFTSEFKQHVVDPFSHEYIHGRTPNPCIECNRHLKWGSLLDEAKKLGADFIATGHYARISKLENGRFAIKTSATSAKDQTYALYNLTQEHLAHTLLPIGDYEKEKVREIAANIGLNVAAKRDSQEICFVPDGDYASFIERETGFRPREGYFKDRDGNILGKHSGITRYTIGQRRGLNLAMGHRVFVTAIDTETNTVIIGENEDLFSKNLTAVRINLMGAQTLRPGDEYIGKIRYNDRGTPCRVVSYSNDELKLEFEKPVRAVTPGQAVVLYRDGFVMAGGIINDNPVSAL